MKRKPSSTSSSGNPTTVVQAFAPDTEFTLTLDGWMLLEALGSNYTNGERPTMRDTVLAILVMTDEDAVFKARKLGKLEQLIASYTADKRPADVLALGDQITAAFQAALAPSDSGAQPSEKKSSPASAGG